MAVKFLDFSGGNDSNNGTTFALRGKTINSGATAARTTAGDVWRIMKSEDPVSLGINATFTNGSASVTLASSLTANISDCDSAWTAVAANVTQSNPTTRKEGAACIQFNVASAFTTGQIAYLTLGLLTDYSAYNKVTFWIQTSAAVAAGVLKLQLCSDTIGAVAVNTITINEALPNGSFHPITVDTGGALGATINSISLNAISDPGTVNITLDNILAANALTLTSLITNNSSPTGFELYGIRSISGTTVSLDVGNSSTATASRGFSGTTATSTCYKVEPIYAGAIAQAGQKAGTSDSVRVTLSGGWDTTAMTSQTGLTILDFRDSSINGITSSVADLTLDHIIVVRASNGFVLNSTEANADNCGTVNCNGQGFSLSGTRLKITTCSAYNGNNNGFTSSGSNIYINGLTANNNTIHGLSITSCPIIAINTTTNNNGSNGIMGGSVESRCYNVTSKNNSSNGVLCSGANGTSIYLTGVTTSGNTLAGLSAASSCKIYADNTACTDSTPFTATASTGRIQLSRIGDDVTVARTYDGTTTTICIQIDTGTVHGSATKSHKHSPQTVHMNSTFPLFQKMGKFAVASSGTLTYSIWVQRSSTNIGAQLLCRGGQSDGVTSDLTAVASAAINTWEQLTITASPTQNAVLEFELQSWQATGAGNAFFSDAAISQ